MRQIVANVGEEGPFRLDSLDNPQRVLNSRVRGMRLVTERIQKKNVQAFQLAERCFRDFAMVGEIGRRSEAGAVNFRFSVNQPNWIEARPENIQGPIDGPQLQQREAAKLVIGVEDITEHLAQKGCGVWPRVERQLPGLMGITQRP